VFGKQLGEPGGKGAVRRGILFTNSRTGMPSRRSVRIRMRVCGWMPSHGGDHQHGAIKHVQHPFHLGDEIRVAGRVDQVYRGISDGERHHGGLDRDTALPLQRHGVGLRTSVIDAADLVDDPSGIKQPLGQACLSGVNMRQDS